MVVLVGTAGGDPDAQLLRRDAQRRVLLRGVEVHGVVHGRAEHPGQPGEREDRGDLPVDRDVPVELAAVGEVPVQRRPGHAGGGDHPLDPDRLAALDLTASDVVAAIREQNVQVAAGVVGQGPTQGADFQLTVNTQGRLQTVEEFGAIIVKTGNDGATTLLKDVARLEMGSNSYALRSLLNNKSAVAIPIFEAPNANASSFARLTSIARTLR